MTFVEEAADICRPLDARTFRDQTLDLADEMIGKERLLISEQEAKANVDGAFRSASYVLEAAAINLRAYSRGMVAKETLGTYFRQAREALDAMERSV